MDDRFKFSYETMNEFLKLWFNDDQDTPRDSILFVEVSPMVSAAESMLRGFYFGSDFAYSDKKRTKRCITFLKKIGLLESELDEEELYIKGKLRAKAELKALMSNPEIKEAFEEFKKQMLKKINQESKNEFRAQKDIIYDNPVCCN